MYEITTKLCVAISYYFPAVLANTKPRCLAGVGDAGPGRDAKLINNNSLIDRTLNLYQSLYFDEAGFR